VFGCVAGLVGRVFGCVAGLGGRVFGCVAGLVGRVFGQSVEGLWLDPWSGQIKDWKIDTCYFPG